MSDSNKIPKPTMAELVSKPRTSSSNNISKAPPPVTLPRGDCYTPKQATNKRLLPNWSYWKHMPDVELWQACALALNINPESLNLHPQNWMCPGIDIFQGYPSDEVKQQHENLLRILNANLSNKQYFTNSFGRDVKLSEFAAWCGHVVRDLTGCDIPNELAALGKDAQASTPVANAVEAGTIDDTLADMFDPATVETLEKMFPANGQWAKWAEKASSNGLINSRAGRAMFNPYKAGIWFLSKGITGWDIARLNRTLANNLPTRSKDNAHLLTGSID